MLTALAALVGLLVGVLTTHLAEAVMAERRLARPACPYCAESAPPGQWSTTVALLTGQWRCRACGQGLRWPRLAGELFVAVTWGLFVALYGLTPRIAFALVSMLPLAMIMVTDLEVRRVPNRIILPAIGVLAVLSALWGPAMPTLKTWSWWVGPLGGLTGFLTMRILIFVGVAIFGEGALGEGDMTLATYVGLVVGFPWIVEALVLTFIFGAVGAAAVLLSRRGGLRTAIPYGPFIILGCAVTQLWGLAIVTWYFNL